MRGCDYIGVDDEDSPDFVCSNSLETGPIKLLYITEESDLVDPIKTTDMKTAKEFIIQHYQPTTKAELETIISNPQVKELMSIMEGFSKEALKDERTRIIEAVKGMVEDCEDIRQDYTDDPAEQGYPYIDDQINAYKNCISIIENT